MKGQLTVRLTDELAEGMATLSRKLHRKRSDLVRAALERFIRETAEGNEERPYERVKKLLGSLESGTADLGSNHRQHLMEAIMGKQFPIAEAKNNLPSLIHDAEQGPPIELTRRGVPVAVLLSKQKYEELTAKQDGFWKTLTVLRRQIEQEQIMISDEDFTGLRDRSSGRDVELVS